MPDGASSTPPVALLAEMHNLPPANAGLRMGIADVMKSLPLRTDRRVTAGRRPSIMHAYRRYTTDRR